LSDYQRFVSYLYEYQNNIKSKNCGFCRVELRDHSCRLEVHLKLPLYPFTPTLKVYVFVPSKEKLYGIFLGNASYHQGNVSGTFTFPEKNILNTDYHFSQLGGIFIQTDAGFCFASAWKDLNIQPEKFVYYEKSANISNPKSIQTKEQKPELCLPNSNAEITLAKSTIESDQPKIEVSPAISNEVENISDTTVQSTTKESESQTTVQENRIQESEIAVEQESEKQVSPEKAEPTLLAASMDTASNPNNFWEHILESYPQCHPFFDDEIHNCVQLSAADVQKISSSGFSICNNAFFRHNFQSFQHFLIGKKACNTDCNKTQYILAVPGIYNPKEQYMASMFGFPHFKYGQNSKCRNNCWGYWYRILPEYWENCRI